MSSKEGILINKTIELLKRQLENPELTDLEKKAKEFYIQELSSRAPIPDSEVFQKPCANIRGRITPADVTDQEVFPRFIRLNSKGQPMTNAKGEIQPTYCYFKNFESYLNHITGKIKVAPQEHRLYEGMTQQEYISFHTPRGIYSSFKEY